MINECPTCDRSVDDTTGHGLFAVWDDGILEIRHEPAQWKQMMEIEVEAAALGLQHPRPVSRVDRSYRGA